MPPELSQEPACRDAAPARLPRTASAQLPRTTPVSPSATAATSAPGLTLTAALLGFFLITLDASVVNVALPAIGRELHGGLTGLQWVVDGYTLAFAALMLSAGALSDRIGASRAFGGGVAVFTAASFACGLSPDLPVLVAARVLQGVAASVMLPSSLALVRQAYPDRAGAPGSGKGGGKGGGKERARAVSLWAAGGASAVALGPVAGGALTAAWSWRAIFFINLPAGLLALLLLARTTRSQRRPAPLDVPGQLTAVLALAALTFSVIEGGHEGLVALAVALAALIAFLRIESRHPHPVVPLSLFRDPTVTVSIAVGSAFSFAFYGVVFVLSLFFQELRGQSALAAGLMFLPMTALISVVNVLAGRVTNRYGPRPPMIAGQLLMLGGLLAVLPLNTSTPAAVLALAMIPLGLGGALAVPPLTAATMEAVPADRAGLAAGVLNAARQAAAGLSVAIFGTLVADPAHFVTGMRTGFLLAAALLTATAAATTLALRPRPRT